MMLAVFMFITLRRTGVMLSTMLSIGNEGIYDKIVLIKFLKDFKTANKNITSIQRISMLAERKFHLNLTLRPCSGVKLSAEYNLILFQLSFKFLQWTIFGQVWIS